MAPTSRKLSVSLTLALVGALLTLGGGAASVEAGPAPAAASAPAALLPSAGISTTMALGTFHACAAGGDGTVSCWGRNDSSQLGDGSTDPANSRVRVRTSGTPLDGATVTQLTAGQAHTCALTSANAIICWGSNGSGEMGTGVASGTPSPPVAVKIAGTPLAGKTVASIAAGTSHTCALTTDGIVACWGGSSYGAIGTGFNVALVPQAITTVGTPLAGKTVAQISTLVDHTCALSTDGVAACWGKNATGQLGDATTDDSSIAVAVTTAGTPLAGKTIVQVAAGHDSTCARTSDHLVACWGYNADRELGDGTTDDSSVPVAVVTTGTPLDGATLVDLQPGGRTTCVRTATDSVVCWGDNTLGQVGVGPDTDPKPPVALVTAGTPLQDKTIAKVFGGVYGACATTTDGIAACWGYNYYGEVGVGTDDDFVDVPSTVITAPVTPQNRIALGTHSCRLSPAGSVSCWGRNDDGELGNGTTTPSSVPVPIKTAGTPLAGKTIAGIGAGWHHTCVLTTEGKAYCWGLNDNGQLGNGSTSSSSVPVAVTTAGTPLAGGKFVVQIDGGQYHTCAVSSDGTAACWGLNQSGQLGNDSMASSPVAVAVLAPPGATAGEVYEQVVAGGTNTCLLTNRGRVACAGQAANGTLGHGPSVEAQIPGLVTTLGTPLQGRSVVQLAMYSAHVCAATDSGAAVCWGNNYLGGLGIGSTDTKYVPVAVSTAGVLGGKVVVQVGTGSLQSCARTADGLEACWGHGSSSQLGNGHADDSFVPVAVTTAGTPLAGETPAELAVGNEVGCVRTTTNVVSCWGSNAYGSLGTGDVTDRSVPTAGTDVASGWYVPISPCRVVDTRVAGGALANREIRDYQVGGTGSAFGAQGGKSGGCGIPANASAVEASVTAVSPSTSGFFRAYPSDQSMPNATFMNYAAHQDITNTGSIAMASTGTKDVKVRNFGGTTQYVIDVQGYYLDPAVYGDGSSVYIPVSPCRVVDTRVAGGALANREIRDYQVGGTGSAFVTQGGKSGGCGIPADASAVEASVTAVSPSTGGFFRAYPSDEGMPNATFMNMAPHQDITNTGSIAMASTGTKDVKVRNFGGSTQYVIDVQGYFIDAFENEGAAYVPLTPCRVVDTRVHGGALANREIRDYQVGGTGSVFAAQGGLSSGCGIPADASAVEASVTAVSPSTSGFFRAYPSDESMPNATFMNYSAHQDITNTGSIAMASTGTKDVKVRNFGGSTQYVIDVQGYFITP